MKTVAMKPNLLAQATLIDARVKKAPVKKKAVAKAPPKKKAVNGNAKGKRGERELAKALTEMGYPAKRGVQYKGGEDSPDVQCPHLVAFHIECKLTASCQLTSRSTLAKWEAQAKADAGQRKIPLVIHRWNGARSWWVRVHPPKARPYWQTLADFLTDLDGIQRT